MSTGFWLKETKETWLSLPKCDHVLQGEKGYEGHYWVDWQYNNMDSGLDKIIVAILNIVKLITVSYLKEYPYSLEIQTEDFNATMNAIYSQMV